MDGKRLFDTIQTAVTVATALFLPQRCVVCDKEGSLLCTQHSLTDQRLDPRGRCQRCFFELVRNRCPKCSSQRIHYDSHKSIYRLSDSVSRAVTVWKFQNESIVSDLFLREFRSVLNEIACVGQIDRVGIIGSGVSGYRSRSFQPCAALLKFAMRELKISGGIDLFKKKVGRKEKQAYKNQSGRYLEIRNSLGLRTSMRPVRNYVLIEDIFTTGATSNEAARMLKLAGVENVHLLTIAMREDIEPI